MGAESMILHHRRVLTMQAQVESESHPELGGAIRRHRDTQVPGRAIPDNFPRRADLVKAGYAALEDLQDVTAAELVECGLSRRAAKAVINALAALEA